MTCSVPASILRLVKALPALVSSMVFEPVLSRVPAPVSVTTPLKTLLAPPEPRVAVKLARLRVPAPPRVARASLSPRVRLAPPAMVTLDEAAKVEPPPSMTRVPVLMLVAPV